jgi:glycerophosphoryl diester phosphodiesterase
MWILGVALVLFLKRLQQSEQRQQQQQQQHKKPQTTNDLSDSSILSSSSSSSSLLSLSLRGFQGNRNHQYAQQQQQQPQKYRPQVCSHQLLNPPTQSLSSSSSSQPVDGSLQAMTALWLSGVACFDIDVVTLPDGSLVASHPYRLLSAIAAKDATTTTTVTTADATILDQFTTLESLRQAGAETQAFPLLDTDLLPHYARLVEGLSPFYRKAHTMHSESQFQFQPQMLQGPLLNLDLKQGPHMTESRLMALVERIFDLHLQDYVGICVTPLDSKDDDGSRNGQLDMLGILHRYNMQQQQATSNATNSDATTTIAKTIPLGLVLRDRVERDQDVSWIEQIVRDHAGSIRLLVASVKFPPSWYEQIHDPHLLVGSLPLTAWTIDQEDDYELASNLNASAVVANRPMKFMVRFTQDENAVHIVDGASMSTE